MGAPTDNSAKSGNPFTPNERQSILPTSTRSSDQQEPAQPSTSSALSREPSSKLVASLQTFPEPPVTGYPATAYPVQYSGGAFGSSYPHYGADVPQAQPATYPASYPTGYPDQGSQPLYSFEQSAPYQNYPAAAPSRESLPCGIGVQWVIFVVGWLLWPMWYVGVILRWVGTFNPRERPGWLANVVMSCVFTVVLLVLVSTGVYRNHHNGQEWCTGPDCLR